MTKPAKPPPLHICPAHAADVRELECSPGFDGCKIQVLRRFEKGAGRRIKYPVPPDIAVLPVSRQRKEQLVKKRLGICWKCNEKVEKGRVLCLYHQVADREYRRDKYARKGRYLNAASYRKELEVLGEYEGEGVRL